MKIEENLKQYLRQCSDTLEQEDPSYSLHGLPTPEQSLRAVELLAQIPKADWPIMLRLLRQGGYDVATPPAEQAADAGHTEDTAHIREFLSDILPRAKWDRLPFGLLYDLYVGWMKKHYPGVRICSSKKFIRKVEPLVGDYGWTYPCRYPDGHFLTFRPSPKMRGPEPMIVEYQCERWYNPTYHGTDVDLIARPRLSASYTGIVRR